MFNYNDELSLVTALRPVEYVHRLWFEF